MRIIFSKSAFSLKSGMELRVENSYGAILRVTEKDGENFTFSFSNPENENGANSSVSISIKDYDFNHVKAEIRDESSLESGKSIQECFVEKHTLEGESSNYKFISLEEDPLYPEQVSRSDWFDPHDTRKNKHTLEGESYSYKSISLEEDPIYPEHVSRSAWFDPRDTWKNIYLQFDPKF